MGTRPLPPLVGMAPPIPAPPLSPSQWGQGVLPPPQIGFKPRPYGSGLCPTHGGGIRKPRPPTPLPRGKVGRGHSEGPPFGGGAWGEGVGPWRAGRGAPSSPAAVGPAGQHRRGPAWGGRGGRGRGQVPPKPHYGAEPPPMGQITPLRGNYHPLWGNSPPPPLWVTPPAMEPSPRYGANHPRYGATPPPPPLWVTLPRYRVISPPPAMGQPPIRGADRGAWCSSPSGGYGGYLWARNSALAPIPGHVSSVGVPGGGGEG